MAPRTAHLNGDIFHQTRNRPGTGHHPVVIGGLQWWMLHALPEGIGLTLALVQGRSLVLGFALALLIRFAWVTAEVIHGAGHTLARVLVDRDPDSFRLDNLLEHRTPGQIVQSLLPLAAIGPAGTGNLPPAWLHAGDPGCWKVRLKASGPILLHLAVIQMAWRALVDLQVPSDEVLLALDEAAEKLETALANVAAAGPPALVPPETGGTAASSDPRIRLSNALARLRETEDALGKSAFDQGKYADALALWRHAYWLDCSAHALLLNLSRAAELSRDRPAAARALRLYLQCVPSSPRRPQLERRLQRLESTP